MNEELILRAHPQSVKNVEFDHLPEPFSGWADSAVVCLNMNPGKGDPRVLSDPSLRHSLETLTVKTLRHKVDYSLWDHSSLCCTGGARWLARITKELRMALGFPPRLFMIELFPYHSVSGFSFPTYLLSNAYRDYLVKRAIDQKKWIVIMRSANKWYDAVCDLRDYPYLIVLKNPRNVVLSNANLEFDKPSLFPGKNAFEELVETVRKQQSGMNAIP